MKYIILVFYISLPKKWPISAAASNLLIM